MKAPMVFMAALILAASAGLLPAEQPRIVQDSYLVLVELPTMQVADVEKPKLDVPYVPTTPEVVEAMLKMVNINKNDKVYDLGCGDGRIVIMAAEKYGARGVGIDIDPERIKEANENAQKAGVADKVEFKQQDLFKSDFKDATVITMYLLPSVNLRLRPQLIADLKPGTRLVSHSFDMGQWEPDRQDTVNGYSRIFHWVVPANMTGTWSWDMAGAGKVTMQVDQKFQRFTATVSANGKTGNVKEGHIEGDQVNFTLEGFDGQGPLRFEGKVNGDMIEGIARPASAATQPAGDQPAAGAPAVEPQGMAWKATRDPATKKVVDEGVTEAEEMEEAA